MLLGLALDGGRWRLLDGGTEAPPSAAAEWSAPLLTATHPDRAGVPRLGPDGPMLVVDVAEGPVGVEYTCLVEYADGTKADLGAWALSADSPNRWIVADDASRRWIWWPRVAVWSSAEL
ncbi:hypothetical protein [Ruania alba]|uniref:Uncharacterized protein n=1 Tax=Ruania alba TaxID=648782 RepID=A0A1H5K7A3_9MICO|nr:hypothetical protein [Ruania alba]SEE60619.1 hypothetical protein SAMN04488554_2121 [Ruania alba]